MVIEKALTGVGLALACALAASGGASATEAVGSVSAPVAGALPSGTPPRPNVVVIYIDDVNPHTRWLWSDADRTPELARFANQGVEFRNAVTSTPLCGPSRATLLTGQYSHGHRVEDNSLEKFDPRRTLPTRLKAAGYHTIHVGKYINGIEEVAPRSRDVRRYARGWKRFDIIWKRARKGSGQFYDYTLWTRHGTKRKGHEPRDHSTFVIGNRVAKHIREAPPDKPVFAVASMGSGHWPNLAFEWHRGDAACEGVAPYRGPSFNEADVSDKPRYIRFLPALAKRSYDLQRQCEEMLSVETALSRITTALRESDRLDDTLLIFTADNGFLLNDHRMADPGGKKWPHALPVPFYALWPAALGDQPRLVREPVSNVDLPVTICALAGCELPGADGQDLTPLLTGEATQLKRRFLYTELLRDWEGMPPWYGLVTTGGFSEEAIWHYTEYGNGGRELYDLSRDPYRLTNLARRPGQVQLLRKLHRILHRQVVRPDKVSIR